MLEDEAQQKDKLEGEIAVLQSQLMQISFEADEVNLYLKLMKIYKSMNILI